MKNYYRRSRMSHVASRRKTRRATLFEAVLFLVLCLGFCASSSPVFALDEPIIIDHTSVAEFENIPDEYIEAAKALSLHFGTTNGGLEIVAGLYFLEFDDPNYDDPKYNVHLNIDGIEEEPDPNPALYLRVESETYHEDYWSTPAGIDATMVFADSGLYGYSMWSWDDEDYTNYDAAFIQDYLAALNSLEQNYPNMNFIYMTRYVIDNTGITDRNDTIRTYCRNNNKVLFDIEDITANSPFDPDWEDYEIVVMKAQAFWVMMAKLAGWGSTTPGRMLGDVTGDGLINILDILQAARHVAELIELQGDALWAADVNGDASVNILDIILIARRAVGLINSF